MSHLAFLHTADANQKIFTAIVSDISPDLPVLHRVEPRLLAKALEAGDVTASIEENLQGIISSLRDEGADLIVCTCSTLGNAAETAGQALGVPVLRIDRPMAEAAIDTGNDILVVACVSSTIAPTLALLARIARDRPKDVKLQSFLLEDVWPLFEAGNLKGYTAAVAERIREHLSGHDAVVLAQASMAGAVEFCRDLPVPIFSSPLLGTQEAVRRFEAIASHSIID